MRRWFLTERAEPARWGSSSFVDWTVRVLRFDVRLHWRRRDGVMGRFGGGWNWKCGFQLGGKTLIISLLVCELSIRRVAV